MSVVLSVCLSAEVSLAAEVSNEVQKTVVLRDGYNGYSGTRDTTLFVEPADWTSTRIPGTAGTGISAVSDIDPSQPNRYRSIALISFDLAGVAESLLQPGDSCATNIEVIKADLELFGQVGNILSYTMVYPMLANSPAWSETDANYKSPGVKGSWPSGSNPFPALNGARLGYFDSVDGVNNGGISRHMNFRIPTDSVKEWICDSSKNKGMAMRTMASGTSRTGAKFFTREFPDLTFRPMFTVQLRRIN